MCAIFTKAMRKSKYSEFCNFAKIRTHSIPYFPKIRNLLRQNRILLKHLCFKVKNVHFKGKNICFISFVFHETKYGINRVKIKFIFSKKLVPTQIPTRIFEFHFGMQGPNFCYSHSKLLGT